MFIVGNLGFNPAVSILRPYQIPEMNWTRCVSCPLQARYSYSLHFVETHNVSRSFCQSAMPNRCLSVNCVIHLRKILMGLSTGFLYTVWSSALGTH